MMDFIDSYMRDVNQYDDDGFDEQKVLKKSISKVLPLIMKNELTPRQNICLRLFYVRGKTQSQIARELKLSQPTVSRHINTAKAILNKCLSYCLYSVKEANEQWLRLQ